MVNYVIYDHPSDYPNHFVVRRCADYSGRLPIDRHCWLTTTLAEARALIPPGLVHVRIPRQKRDESAIVEICL